MAELNIDSSLLKTSHLVQKEEKLVEMQNGCICCTLREDLLEEVAKIAKSKSFDYLIIESTGISEPMQVAETFEIPMQDEDVSLHSIARLDTCVTVVDASMLLSNISSIDALKDREEGSAGPGDERTIAELLIDQIEFANVLLLNKTDLIAGKDTDRIKGFLKSLNPEASIILTQYSQVDLKRVINTQLFDMEKARQAPGWLKSLTETHVPETEEYGVGSFVYRARKPFHPKRLRDFLDQNFVVQELFIQDEDEGEERGNESNGALLLPASVMATEDDVECKRSALSKYGQLLRSKGFFWLSTRHDSAGDWSQAGPILQISSSSPWFAAIPEETWEVADVDMVRQDFVEGIGDRRQEIVFIGIDIKKKILIDALNTCLLEDNEEVEEGADAEFAKWPYFEIVEESETDDEEEEEK